MIRAETLLGEMTGRGVTAVTGVPCSFLTPIINSVIGDPSVRYLAATQEGEAAALAAGAWLGGGLGCVISQNSGLGNMVNPLTSLLNTARIPALLLVTWRGQPGRPDEPQHSLMGEITLPMLELMRVRSAVLDADPAALRATMDTAFAAIEAHELPYTIVVPKGVVADEPLTEPALARKTCVVVRHGVTDHRPSRAEVLEQLLATAPPDAAIVSTTGWTSRELYTLDDREQHFYLVGAMGSAIAVGLGVSLHSPRPTIVVDGDGALLMRMGSLATVGAHGGSNLVHLVLDNGVHDSTGGQRTLSGIVDLPAAAAACGYGQVHVCATSDDLSDALRSALAGQGPSLIYLPIRPGSLSNLGRPKVTPSEVARRFRSFVTSGDRIQVGVS
ncbi:MAG TPA: phosphonopyruvate decarboxylase [Candidatus Limnocylindrales bacterium]|nr:phosphonopyruvate decarboxylase [Candidatus Limnocylindrales bacterium]